MDRHQFKTLIYEKELDRIAGWVEEYPSLETGGDLFGFWTHSGAPVIQYVLGPGPGSEHYETSFFQDKEHLIEAGRNLRENHGLQHIGEWHSHHQLGLAQPSQGDENTVFRALEKYNFPRFLLCIANLGHNRAIGRQWNVNVECFLFANSQVSSQIRGGSYQVGAWVVLPGDTPFSHTLSRRNSRSSKSWNVEKTTLETEVVVTTEPIEIFEKLWYSTPEGQKRLKELYDLFNENFRQCEMLQDGRTERAYFSFLAPVDNNYDEWRVEFPDDFPNSSPLFQPKGKPSFQLKDWSGNNDYFGQIKSFIKSSYKKKQ